MENENVGLENVETTATDVETTTTENKNVEKTFTQEQVNAIVKDRLDRVYKRYGVENKEGLDNLVNRALSYEQMSEEFDKLNNTHTELTQIHTELQNQNRELAKKYAFASKNIKPELYSDIEMYFKGKGVDITEETLGEELKTHDSWFNKPSAIIPLGSETKKPTVDSGKELASKIFGVNL